MSVPPSYIDGTIAAVRNTGHRCSSPPFVKPVAVLQYYVRDGVGFFGKHLRTRGVPLRVFELFNGDTAPALLESFSGLCLLGGPMSVNDDWRPLREGERLVLEALRTDVPVFQWHNEMFSVPQGARLIATGQWCAHQAFAIGSLHIGVQFHCEIDQPKIDSWLTVAESADIDRFADSPAVQCREAIRSATESRLAEGQRAAAHIYDRWIERVAS